MLLKSSFNKNSYRFLDTSKRRIIGGVFLGVSYAVVFYALLQFFRKSIIVFDAILNDYELFLITEEANQVYNFLLAFISVFFAFTIVISYLLDVPKKFLSKYNYKRKFVLNQQRITN